MPIAFRFLSRLFVSSAAALGPSVVGDLFRKEYRGEAMAIAIAFPLVGPFIAPVIGSYVAKNKGWRWTIWIVVIATGVVVVVAFMVFKETYKVIILERKTQCLRETLENEFVRSKHEEATKNATITQSMSLPLKMMFFSPIVLITTFYTVFTYGISYLILTTLVLPLV